MFSQYEVPLSNIMVNFGVGQPNTNKLPLNWFNETIKNMVITNPEFLQYHCIEGYPTLIEKMKSWLKKQYYNSIIEISNNELFMTNGNTGALNLLMTLLMKPGDTIILENPTYFLAKNIFEEFGLTIKYVNMEDDGLNIEELELLLQEFSAKQTRLFLYTIPFFHNPTSISLSEKKKLEIKTLFEKYENFYILSDEVYHFLYFNEKQKNIYPLAFYHENILSLGSFSKILAPSLRVGWIYQKSGKILDILKKSGILDSSGGINPLGFLMIDKTLEMDSMDGVIQNNRNLLLENSFNMVNALDTFKKEYNCNKSEVEFIHPNGGYFIWVKLSDTMDAKDFLGFSIENKVKFQPGYKFGINMNNYVRLSFSYYEKDDIYLGISRLINSYKHYVKMPLTKNINIKDTSIIKVYICGSSGKLGNLIKNYMLEGGKYEFKGSINREITEDTFEDSVSNFNKNDIIIDVSNKDMTRNLITYLIDNNINKSLLIGTSNLDKNTIDLLKLYSLNNLVYYIQNFSEGIQTIKKLADIVDCVSSNWTINIKETHHLNKIDKPSGTAMIIKETINRECKIKSFREGDIIGYHEITAENECEVIKISHLVKHRSVFAKGALLIIDRMIEELNINKKTGFFTSY